MEYRYSMNIYEEYLLPHIINCVCGLEEIESQRKKVVPLATGKVLEIGAGSGLNFKYYDPKKVEAIWALEPSEGMKRKAQKNLSECPIEVIWLNDFCENITLENRSIDTVVLTYTLCTIPDVERALSEIRRVLKPEGKLIFCEHGVSPDQKVLAWQRRLNPIWKPLMGGCNLNRNIPKIIESSSFCIEKLEQDYIDGPKIASYQYLGQAGKYEEF